MDFGSGDADGVSGMAQQPQALITGGSTFFGCCGPALDESLAVRVAVGTFESVQSTLREAR